MSQVSKKSSSKFQRSVAALSALALAMVTVLGMSSSATASEMAPIIEYDRNVLASNAVHSEFGERLVRGLVGLKPTPLTRVLTTDRAGYSFGGWSYSQGGPAVTTLETETYTTDRIRLFAVWNTKLNLDPNGGTGLAATVDYRFSSTLTLPATSDYKKNGFEFAGWSSSPTSNIFVTTYRATADAVGNPSVYAVWKKTVNFASRGSTGVVPVPVTILEGGAGIALPTASQVNMTRPGFKFMGWSTKPRGKVVKNSTAYLPKKANVTLNAVWKKN